MRKPLKYNKTNKQTSYSTSTTWDSWQASCADFRAGQRSIKGFAKHDPITLVYVFCVYGKQTDNFFWTVHGLFELREKKDKWRVTLFQCRRRTRSPVPLKRDQVVTGIVWERDSQWVKVLWAKGFVYARGQRRMKSNSNPYNHWLIPKYGELVDLLALGFILFN